MARNEAKITLLAKWKDQGAKKGVANLESSIVSLGKKAAGVFISFAVLRGIKEQILSQIALMDSLGKLGVAYGISARRLAGWSGALRLGGTDLGMFDQSLRSLERAIRQAMTSAITPGGKAFAALGVEIRDASGELRSLDDIILDVAEGMKNFGNVTERTMHSQALFTTGHIKLMPVLLQGRDALNKQIEAQAQLSGVTNAGAEAAAKYEDAITKLEIAFDGFLLNSVTPLLGPLTKLLDIISEISADPGGAFRAATGFGFGPRIPGMGQVALDRQRAGGGFAALFNSPLFPGAGRTFTPLGQLGGIRERSEAADRAQAEVAARERATVEAARFRRSPAGRAEQFNLAVERRIAREAVEKAARERRALGFRTAADFAGGVTRFGVDPSFGGVPGGPEGLAPLFADLIVVTDEMVAAWGKARDAWVAEQAPSAGDRFRAGGRAGFLGGLGLGDGSNIAGSLGALVGSGGASLLTKTVMGAFGLAVDRFSGAADRQREAANALIRAAALQQRLLFTNARATAIRFEGGDVIGSTLGVARAQFAQSRQRFETANDSALSANSPLQGLMALFASGASAEDVVAFLRNETQFAGGFTSTGLQDVSIFGDTALINTLIDLIRLVEGNTAATAENTAPDVQMLGLNPLATSGALRFAQTAQGRALILAGAMEQANLAGKLGLSPNDLGGGGDPTFIPGATGGGGGTPDTGDFVMGIDVNGNPIKDQGIIFKIVVNGNVATEVVKLSRSGDITIDLTNPKSPKIIRGVGAI